jgi:hypothetical protein
MRNKNQIYEFSRLFGALIAPVIIEFIKFVQSNAKSRIVCAYRDGEVIHKTAKFLSRINPDFKECAEWGHIYLTRSVIQESKKEPELLRRYLKQNNLDTGDWTFTDIGFTGSLWTRLYKEYNVKPDAVFMFRNWDAPTEIQGMHNNPGYDPARWQRTAIGIFESFPKAICPCIWLAESNNIVNPVLQKAPRIDSYNGFYRGIYEFCLDYSPIENSLIYEKIINSKDDLKNAINFAQIAEMPDEYEKKLPDNMPAISAMLDKFGIKTH